MFRFSIGLEASRLSRSRNPLDLQKTRYPLLAAFLGFLSDTDEVFDIQVSQCLVKFIDQAKQIRFVAV
jgi:hypothetical protein